MTTACPRKSARHDFKDGQTLSSLELSPDEASLIATDSTTQDWHVRIFDTRSWKERLSVEATCYAIARDWSVLVVAGSMVPTVRLLDATTGAERAHFEATSGIGAVALSADGKQVAAAHLNDGGVQVWDVSSGRELLRTAEAGDAFRSLSFTSDGRTLVGLSDFGSKALSVADGAVQPTLKRQRISVTPLRGLAEPAIAASVERIAAALPARSEGDQLRVVLDSTGKHVATALTSNYGPWLPVQLWDIDAAHGVAVDGPGSDCAPKTIRFSSDGSVLAIAYNDDSIWLLDSATGKKKSVLFPGHCNSHSSSYGRGLLSLSAKKLALFSNQPFSPPTFEQVSLDP